MILSSARWKKASPRRWLAQPWQTCVAPSIRFSRQKGMVNIAVRRISGGVGMASGLVPTCLGNVSLDNAITLEADMFFVIHPNQYLPETGYLLCGEPVLITANKPEILRERL